MFLTVTTNQDHLILSLEDLASSLIDHFYCIEEIATEVIGINYLLLRFSIEASQRNGYIRFHRVPIIHIEEGHWSYRPSFEYLSTRYYIEDVCSHVDDVSILYTDRVEHAVQWPEEIRERFDSIEHRDGFTQ